MKRGVIFGLAILALLALVSEVGATCTASGKISRLRSATPPTTNAFVDVAAPGNLPAFATFFTVTTDRFFPMLAAAQAGHLTVSVTGSAGSCAPTGVFRAGGNVIFVDIFTNQ